MTGNIGILYWKYFTIPDYPEYGSVSYFISDICLILNGSLSLYSSYKLHHAFEETSQNSQLSRPKRFGFWIFLHIFTIILYLVYGAYFEVFNYFSGNQKDINIGIYIYR